MKKKKKDTYWTYTRAAFKNPILTFVLSYLLFILIGGYFDLESGLFLLYLICTAIVINLERLYYMIRYPVWQAKPQTGKNKAGNPKKHNAFIRSIWILKKISSFLYSPVSSMSSSAGRTASDWYTNLGASSQADAERYRQQQEREAKAWQHTRDVENAYYQEYLAKKAQYEAPNSRDAYYQENRAKAARNQANKPYW